MAPHSLGKLIARPKPSATIILQGVYFTDIRYPQLCQPTKERREPM